MPGQQQEKAFISQSGFYKESLCSSVLGSTTAITDANGSLTQHVLYFAYGETFVDEHRNSTNSPYLYNGKELDTETGRYYYGARYYEPKVSLWIGVDPLAEKYPSMSPFVYCANNPIRFLDPDGNEIVDANGKKITYSKEKGWSSNATEDVKIVHQSLMLTEKGREQWNKAYTSDRKILFDVNTEETRQVEGQDVLGITENPIRRNSTGGVYLDLKEITKIFLYTKTIEKSTLNRGLPLREALSATAGHEIEHATNKENITDALFNARWRAKIRDVESVPNKIGSEIRQESRKGEIHKMTPKGL